MKTGSIILYILLILSGAGLCSDSIDNDMDWLSSADTVKLERTTFRPEDFRLSNQFFPGRIGLALSGGGARGLAQIGVLKAFEESGFKIDYIAGTSMGSIIGGLYAAGHSATELEHLAERIHFDSLFSDRPQRKSLFITQRAERDQFLVSIRFDGIKPYIPRALTAGQRLTSYLTDLTIPANYRCDGDFDRLPIAFRAVTTDLASGEIVPVGDGSLAMAMRASMAFPLAFTAVEDKGRLLMDGGILDPIPVDICRNLGADYVIAVNTSSELLPAKEINNPVDIANQVTTIMSQNALLRQLALADYAINLPMDNLHSIDFDQQDSLIAIGYAAGRDAIKQILNNEFDRGTDHKYYLLDINVPPDQPELEKIKKSFPFQPGDFFDIHALEMALKFADREGYFNQLACAPQFFGSMVTLNLSGRLNHTWDDLDIEFIGNRSIPDSVLNKFFAEPGDEPLSFRRVVAAADSIFQLYTASGNDLANIETIGYDHEAHKLYIKIDEGLLYKMEVEGNRRTRDWVILTDFPIGIGQPVSLNRARRGMANIFGSGFFEQVNLELVHSDSGAIAHLSVKEKKFTQIRFGAHWDDEYQSELTTELLDDNMLGIGLQASAQARFSERRKAYSLSIEIDRLSRSWLTARTSLYFSRLNRRLFYDDGSPNGYRLEDRWGWTIRVGQQISRFGNLMVAYRLEDIFTRLSKTDATENHVFSAFSVMNTVETFDRFPYPNFGHRHTIEVEFTGQWLGGTFEDYNKINLSIEEYLKIGNYFNFRPKLSFGTSTANLPAIEKFFMGGIYSFFGYRTDQLNGDKYVLGNFQLRAKLPWRIYLFGRFDWGNVFNDYEQIKIRDFRKGYGLILSLDTPLGPFDFGYGRAEGSPGRFYLNLGLSF